MYLCTEYPSTYFINKFIKQLFFKVFFLVFIFLRSKKKEQSSKKKPKKIDRAFPANSNVIHVEITFNGGHP